MARTEELQQEAGGSGSAPPASLDEGLRHALHAARSAWPEIFVPDEVFLQFLAGKVAPEQDTLTLLGALHTSDLYLACACLLGDSKAIASVEQHYLSQLGASSMSSSGFSDELKQTLRERVFVSRHGAPPRISSYTGRGPLAGWLRIVAARLAVDLRKQRTETANPPAASNLAIPVLDLELQYLKDRYRSEFEAAIQAAFAALTPRERAVLRLHGSDSIPFASIATMYSVSPRTVQRWVSSAHGTIKTAVRRALTSKFALTERELDSLLGLVMSQLNLTLPEV